MRSTTLLAMLLALLLVSAAQALPIPAVTFTETSSTTPVSVPETVGWKFNVVSPVLIGALGVFDSGLDGLLSSHQVGIWNNGTNTLVTSTTVLSGTAGALLNQFRYASITPVLLGVGTYTIGATWGVGFGSDDYVANTTNFHTIPNISYLISEYDQVPSITQLTMPTTAAGFFSNGMFGPNFTVVPEPSSMVLLAAGLLILAGATFRRQRTGTH